jgi:hypothetical protein
MMMKRISGNGRLRQQQMATGAAAIRYTLYAAAVSPIEQGPSFTINNQVSPFTLPTV